MCVFSIIARSFEALVSDSLEPSSSRRRVVSAPSPTPTRRDACLRSEKYVCAASSRACLPSVATLFGEERACVRAGPWEHVALVGFMGYMGSLSPAMYTSVGFREWVERPVSGRGYDRECCEEPRDLCSSALEVLCVQIETSVKTTDVVENETHIARPSCGRRLYPTWEQNALDRATADRVRVYTTRLAGDSFETLRVSKKKKKKKTRGGFAREIRASFLASVPGSLAGEPPPRSHVWWRGKDILIYICSTGEREARGAQVGAARQERVGSVPASRRLG